jgi:hypothetical protein
MKKDLSNQNNVLTNVVLVLVAKVMTLREVDEALTTGAKLPMKIPMRIPKLLLKIKPLITRLQQLKLLKLKEKALPKPKPPLKLKKRKPLLSKSIAKPKRRFSPKSYFPNLVKLVKILRKNGTTIKSLEKMLTLFNFP